MNQTGENPALGFNFLLCPLTILVNSLTRLAEHNVMGVHGFFRNRAPFLFSLWNDAVAEATRIRWVYDNIKPCSLPEILPHGSTTANQLPADRGPARCWEHLWPEQSFWCVCTETMRFSKAESPVDNWSGFQVNFVEMIKQYFKTIVLGNVGG